MIERSTLMEMFQLVESQGLSTDQELLWGYFFIDKDPEKLKAMIPELESRGYTLVDVYEPGEEPGDEEDDEEDEHHAHDCGHEHEHGHAHEQGQAHEHETGHSHQHAHKHECGLEHAHEHKHECGSGHAHEHEHKHECGHEHAHEHKHEAGHSHEHGESCGHSHGHDHEHEHEHEHEHDDEEDDEYYCLHVEKVEKHTIDSLDVRNKEFAALAEKYGVEGYDGMDVGPADGSGIPVDDEDHEHCGECDHH